MPSISTAAESINIAKYYLSKNLWLAFGGSSLVWANNNNPPYPAETIRQFSDLRGLLYLDIKMLVTKDNQGSIITSNGVRYSYINEAQATQQLIDNSAYYLYMEATLPASSSLVGENFRLLGIADNVNIATNPNLSTSTFVDQSDVISYDLNWVETMPEYTVSSSAQVFQFVRRW